MYRFTVGTEKEIRDLRDELSELEAQHRISLFSSCVMPRGCVPARARVGFEKTGTTYRIYIDKNIRFDCDDAKFMRLLADGELQFGSFEDMMAFLKGLKPLFEDKKTGKDEEAELYDRDAVNGMIEEGEKQKVKAFPAEAVAGPLKKTIFGQDRQIDTISGILACSSWAENDHPVSMAFMGPTGTGKTQCAESLADALSQASGVTYGTIRINCNVFVGDHAVQAILGAPPSYVGYSDKTLLEPVRSNPYQVIILDEIEKASLTLITALMEAVDTGFLRLNNNTPDIDIRQCVLVFTSNIPVSGIGPDCGRFEENERCKDAFTSYCSRPEISSRIGNYIVFDKLGRDAVISIVNKSIVESLHRYGLTPVRIDEHLIFDLTMLYLNNSTYGARSIRSSIENCLGSCHALYAIVRDRKEDNIKVTVRGDLKNGITIKEAK